MSKQPRKYCKSQWEAAAYLHYRQIVLPSHVFSRRDQNLAFTQLEQRGQLEIRETKTSDSFVRSVISYPKVRRQSVCDESKSSLGCTFHVMVTSTKLIRLHTHHFRQPVWGIPILQFSNFNNDHVEIITILI